MLLCKPSLIAPLLPFPLSCLVVSSDSAAEEDAADAPEDAAADARARPVTSDLLSLTFIPFYLGVGGE